MWNWLNRLDRRLIFLAMMIAVAVPVLTRPVFPELPTPMTKAIFDRIDTLPAGSIIAIAMDYDMSSAAELDPMATAILRHCCARRHRIIMLTLWPTAAPIVDAKTENIIVREFANQKYVYGIDYVNLGYIPGEQVAPKLITADLIAAKGRDVRGQSLTTIPLVQKMTGLKDSDLIVSISAGFPGLKEWIQYSGTAYGVSIAGGCTGVAAPQLYPYFPSQLSGLLVAIKGAAEYEAALTAAYPETKKFPARALQRMGPQLVAHRLVIGLILLGNVIHFVNRRKGMR